MLHNQKEETDEPDKENFEIDYISGNAESENEIKIERADEENNSTSLEYSGMNIEDEGNFKLEEKDDFEMDYVSSNIDDSGSKIKIEIL